MNRTARIWLAAAWLFLTLVSLPYVYLWAQNNQPDFELSDLLPENQAASTEEKWLQQAVSQKYNDTVIFAIALADDKPQTRQLVKKTVQAWTDQSELFTKSDAQATNSETLEKVHLLALGQMTFDDYEVFLHNQPQDVYEYVLSNAMVPVDASFFTFSEDPLGVQNSWARERLKQWQIRIEDDLLLTEHENKPYALYFFHLDEKKIIQDGSAIFDTINRLKTSLQRNCGATLIASGLPLFTAAAALQAQNELTYFGLLSTLGIIAITWFWFGNLKALLLILLVSAQAFLLAIAATILVSGKIHLITLVFGTTLIGITVDYSAHYLCTRLGQTKPTNASLKTLLPSLTLALLSTILGFSLMATTPFPGLTQIAIFCVTGVVAAYAAVVLWLPFLVSDSFPFRSLLQKFALKLLSLPSFETLHRRTNIVIAGFFIVICTIGVAKLDLKSSLYDLNNPPQELLGDSATISSLLNTPSMSQYFLIEASDFEELLQKEETLLQRFEQLKLRSVRLSSASDWIMSEKRSEQTRQTYSTACRSVSDLVSNILGAPLTCELKSLSKRERLEIAQSLNILPPMQVTENKISSLILISGINRNNLDMIKNLQSPSEAIYFRNYPQQISELLVQYCNRVAWLLAAAALGAVILLTIYFKKLAWRAYCPCLCGIALTMAMLGLLGYGLSLFSLLALVLLLGLGLDYGIFLTATSQSNSRTVVAVTFAVLTTLLSFGLLAFSDTPALKSFGLCIMIGEFFIWCLTPTFRKVKNRDKTTSC